MQPNSKVAGASERDSVVLQRYTSFLVAGRLYGINVTRVQEVVKPLAMTRVPLAPPYIAGLVNLRGQVATAIGLRELFKLEPRDPSQLMNVVCKTETTLLSFLVDEIGDVLEVGKEELARMPSTISEDVRRFLGGVVKVNEGLLSIIEIDPVAQYLGLAGRRNAA